MVTSHPTERPGWRLDAAGLPSGLSRRLASWRSRRLLPQLGWAALVGLVGFLIIGPILALEQRAFADGASAFLRMFGLPRSRETLEATIILSFASSLIAVVLGTALAWCASLLPAPVRRVGVFIPMVPLMLPTAAAVLGWVFLLSPSVGYLNLLLRQLPGLEELPEGPFDVYTLPWIVIITGLLLSAFTYIFVHNGLESIGQELEAAAAACGAGPVRRFFTITLPLLRPSLLFATGIAFLLGLGQFTVPLLLGRTGQINVLTTEMFYVTLHSPIDYGLGAALGFPILLIGVVLVLVQKRLLGEQRRFVVVSGKSSLKVGKTRWWAFGVICLYGVLTTLLPILALVYVSLSPFWAGDLSFERLTTRHYAAVFTNRQTVGSMVTSVTASLAAVALLIPLGFGCAFALLQSTPVLRPLRAAIDLLVTLPMAIPASLMGFGILFAYTQPPFLLYGTTAIIVVTYVTLMIGYATRLQFATLLATGREFREASQASGAGPLRTLARVLLPMTRKGIAATAALTFILLSHEFSASMMVRSIRTQVMGSVLYDSWSGAVYPEAAALALVMVGVTIAGLLVVGAVGGRDAMR